MKTKHSQGELLKTDMKRLGKLAVDLVIKNLTYYNNKHSPRMTRREYDDLRFLGFWIQEERPLHEPTIYYAMEEYEKHNLDMLKHYMFE